MTETAQEILPHFKWVKIDETRHWAEEWRAKNKIKKIVSTYIFNANEVTHCCEITPSYWLEHIESCAELEQDAGVADMTDAEYQAFLEECGRIDEEMRDEELQNDNSMYVHCREVDGKVGYILEAAERLGVKLNLWNIQNLYVQVCNQRASVLAAHRETAASLAARIHLTPDVLPNILR
jgi:hypothetical protein